MRFPRAGLLLALLAVTGCRSRAAAVRDDGARDASVTIADAAAPAPFSEEGILATGARYLDDPDYRRTALVDSLANPNNTYSRTRLESYGLKTKGWDLLPEWNPQSLPVGRDEAALVKRGQLPAIPPSTPRLWDGKRPATFAGWVALGREVFFGYPLRVEVFMNFALAHPEIGERVGVRAGPDGVYPGIRTFVDTDGKPALGITCAICHVDVDDKNVVVGRARRSFDYGALRLAYHAKTKVPIEPDLARRMKSWGPGRADVTEDDDEDPVAIPDLWGLADQSALTQAGTIKHPNATALVIRQETQLLHSNHQKIRPPRELAFALATFLYSLRAPLLEPKVVPPRGAELFAEHCRGCHSNPSYGGPPVAAEAVGTDPSLARGGARGTGKYRPPALLRVSAAAPYFHHGAVPTLDDVLSPDRFEATYAKSPLGRGPVPGHRYGVDLPRADRDALLAWLKAL